jgi:hypothetical protein
MDGARRTNRNSRSHIVRTRDSCARTPLEKNAITCLTISEPVKLHLIPVWIGSAGCAQGYWLSYDRINGKNILTWNTVDHYIGRVISVLVVLDGPIHPRREIVLKGISPPPNGCEIGHIEVAVDTSNRVMAELSLGPNRPVTHRSRFAIRICLPTRPSLDFGWRSNRYSPG